MRGVVRATLLGSDCGRCVRGFRRALTGGGCCGLGGVGQYSYNVGGPLCGRVNNCSSGGNEAS